MFARWLQEHGLEPGVIELTAGPYGEGGFASAEIPSGSVVSAIPYSLVLSSSKVWDLTGDIASVPAAVWSALQTAPSESKSSTKWSNPQYCDATGPDGAPALLTDSRYCLYVVAVVSRASKACCGCRCPSASDSISASCCCCKVCKAAYGCGLGITSKWTGYFRNIPTTHNLPTEWASGQLEWIRGTNLYTGTMERYNHMKEWFDRVLPLIKGYDWSPPVSWERFLWAHAAFASRTFPAYLCEVPVASTSTAPAPTFSRRSLHACFLPWLDMLNHKAGTPITWRQTHAGIQFVVESDIAKGSEIFNNYGPKSNEEFIMNYGFCLEENVQDFAWVSVAVRPEDPLASLRSSVISLAKLDVCEDGERQQAVASGGGSPGIRLFLRHSVDPWPLLALTRVCVMPEHYLRCLMNCFDATDGSELRDLLCKPMVEFPVPQVDRVAVPVLLQLLRGKLMSANEALSRVDSASVDEKRLYRHQCAWRYVSSQVSIYSHVIDWVERMASKPNSVFRAEIAATTCSESQTVFVCGEAASSLCCDKFATRVNVPVKHDEVIVTLDSGSMLCAATAGSFVPDLMDVLDGIDGLGDEYVLAILLLSQVGVGRKSPFEQLIKDIVLNAGCGPVVPSRKDRKGVKRKAKVEDPTHPNTLPLLTNALALGITEDSPLCSVLTAAKADIADTYDDLFPALSEGYPTIFPARVFSKGNFEWAVATVLALSVRVDVDTGDDSASCVGLLPIVPSITHSVAPTANVTLRIDAVSGAPILAVVALDDLAPGAVVSFGLPFDGLVSHPHLTLVRSPRSDWQSFIAQSCIECRVLVSSPEGPIGFPLYAVNFPQPQLRAAITTAKLTGGLECCGVVVPSSTLAVPAPEARACVSSPHTTMHQCLLARAFQLLARHEDKSNPLW